MRNTLLIGLMMFSFQAHAWESFGCGYCIQGTYGYSCSNEDPNAAMKPCEDGHLYTCPRGCGADNEGDCWRLVAPHSFCGKSTYTEVCRTFASTECIAPPDLRRYVLQSESEDIAWLSQAYPEGFPASGQAAIGKVLTEFVLNPGKGTLQVKYPEGTLTYKVYVTEVK